MNTLQKLAARIALKASSYSGMPFTLHGQGQSNQKLLSEVFGNRTHTGKAVTDKTSMQITTVWACVRLLSETMGGMPSSIFMRQKDGSVVKATDHPLHEILVEQPNSEMNGLEFREARTSNLAMRGNQYAVINRRGNGDVMSLMPIPASEVIQKKDSTTNFETQYGIMDRGKRVWMPSEKIWHTKGFSFNGMEGLSPLSYARESMALALAGEEFNSKLFGQGLMPSAVISIPDWLKEGEREIANKKLMEMHAGMDNMNKAMLLEGGMKVEKGLMSPDDAQFLQLRQFTVIELCRLFGVKPHMIAALERATDNNIEQLGLEFVTYTMMPFMRRDEVGARKLFKPGDKNKYFYKYNPEGLLRADSAARASLYSILLQNGVLNRNEVRELENRNKSNDDGMNDYTVQSNMAMIDQIAALVAARETASSKQTPPPVKSGDTNITVSPAAFTLNQEGAEVKVDVPEREANFEVTMPEIKQEPAPPVNVDVSVNGNKKTKTTFVRDKKTQEILSTITEEVLDDKSDI